MRQEPVAGNNVYLTIDFDLQQILRDAPRLQKEDSRERVVESGQHRVLALRSPQGEQPREDHFEPHANPIGPAALRAGAARAYMQGCGPAI